MRLGRLVTSYVITTNVKEQFAVFGGSGAPVFGLLTWPPAFLLGRPAPDSASAGRFGLADLGEVAVYCTERDEREFGELGTG